MKHTELIKIRLELNLTQVEFAHFLDVSPRTLWGWENGQGSPSGPLIHIATKLMRSPGYTPFVQTVYWWLCHRNFLLIKQKKKQTKIRWENLSGQFGAIYARLADFRVKFSRALKKVLLHYPEARKRVFHHPGYLLIKAFKSRSQFQKNQQLTLRIDDSLRAALAARVKMECISRHKRSLRARESEALARSPR